MRKGAVGTVLNTVFGKTVIAATIFFWIQGAIAKQAVKIFFVFYFMTRKFITLKIPKK